MRVYLDMCCYKRPYDDQSEARISLETKAKLKIQDLIRKSALDLVDSYMLRYECEQNPFASRRTAIFKYIDAYASLYVGLKNSASIEEDAKTIMDAGIKYKDACHVACAIYADCDYLITTDKRLLKYKSDKINVISPIDFLKTLEV